MLKSPFIPASNHDSRRLMGLMHGMGDHLDSYRMARSPLRESLEPCERGDADYSLLCDQVNGL